MEELKRNKMGHEPVGKLMFKMSLPMMISMLVLALYNIVDSVFISMLPDGEAGLTALSLAFPFQMLITGVAVGTGIGTCSLASRRLGEGKKLEADRAASHGLFLSIISGIMFGIIGFFVLGDLAAGFTNNTTIQQYAKDYLTVVSAFCIFSMIQTMCEKIMQSIGKTTSSMFIQLTGAVVNIVMDPILIFGLLGFPAMGVMGAAIATVAGQFVGMILGIILLIKEKGINVRVFGKVKDAFGSKLPAFKFDGKIAVNIYRVGLPAIVMQSISSVTTLALNAILSSFNGVSPGVGDTAVAVLGVYFKLQSFVFMPVFGLNSGTMPIIAFNFGARNKIRVRKALKLGIISAMIIMLCGLVIFQLIPDILLKLFNAEDNLMSIGTQALRTISICFPFAAFSIMCGSLFQGTGKGMYSMITTIFRQIVTILPAAYLLATLTGDVMSVWFAYPIAEVVSTAVCAFLLIKTLKKLINPLPDMQMENLSI